jgi:phosphatidylglycerol lysyltransferase
MSALSTRTKAIALGAVAFVLLVVAVVALDHAVGGDAVQKAKDALSSLPASRVALAVLLTIASYALLTAYDALALRYAQKEVAPQNVVLTSFIAFAFAHNVGFGFLAGASVRARRYGRAGLDGGDVAKVAAFSGATTWLGIASVGGVMLLLSPPSPWLRAVGALALLLVAGYIVLCARAREPVKLWRFTIAVPSLPLALVQLALAAVDWLLAGAVLAALVAVDARSFVAVIGAFALASVVAIVSHVPGGLGVLESMVLVLLSPSLPAEHVLGALVAFRAIYYVIPFVTALVVFGFTELHASETGRLFLRACRGLVPEISALLVLGAGAVLLVSGSRPGLVDRLKALHRLVPLALIEGSHLVGSALGIILVLLARGLWRRLDSAWMLAIVVLLAGSVASLLKGFDWEEALLLVVVAALLAPNRDKFYRTGSLFSEPRSPSFLIGVALVVAATVYLGFLSYANVEYREQLWWQMALDADAPRFLRALVAMVAVVLAYGAAQLVRPTKLRKRAAGVDDVAKALAVARVSEESQARLVATGDKTVLFSDDGSAFLMYSVEGRAFIAMGDPVGNPEKRGELIKKFRKMADEHDAACAFYQVVPEAITDYVDRGFALVKLGEEARVDLADFGLEGRAMKSLRASHKKAAKEVTFAVLEDCAPVLAQLRAVSDKWLLSKNVREKGFSLGCFDDDYLKTGPVAVVKKGDDIVAFANIWPTDTKVELSIDLMRHDERAPNGTMDFLFAELMLWGKAQGYRWFSLGMAPMSGLEDGPLSPWWSRAFSLIFRHGEALYNFKGLRAYKEKFDPVWRGRYLACSSALDVPRVLASVATLTSRGLGGVFAR